MIENDVARLKIIKSDLEKIRLSSNITEDMYEAVDDWRSMGEGLLQAAPWEDYRDLGKQNLEQLKELQDFYGSMIDANPMYVEAMEIGTRLIAAAMERVPDPRGCLGCNDLIRDTFAFLISEYGFIRSDTPADLGYARGGIKVRVSSLPCWDEDLVGFMSLDRPNTVYGIADIRFMANARAPIERGEKPVIETEAEAKAAYAAMAALLRRDCGDILAGVPGAFERLVAAAAERDRLIGEMMDRLHGAERRDGAGAGACGLRGSLTPALSRRERGKGGLSRARRPALPGRPWRRRPAPRIRP